MATPRRKAAHPPPPPRLLLLVLLLLFSSRCSAAPKTNSRGGGGAGGLYSTLGIPRTASSSDVKKAYRKMALRHHPDKVPASDRPEAERRFKDIAKAYEYLGDEGKRRMYDRYGDRCLEPNFAPGMFDAYAGASSGEGGGGGGGGGAGEGARAFQFGSGGFPGAFGGGGGGSPFGGGGGGGGGMGGFADVDINEILRQMMGGAPWGMDPRGGPTASGFGDGGTSGLGDTFGGGGGGDRDRHRRTSSPSQGGGRRRRRRPRPMPVHCSLEELFGGCTKRLRVSYPSSSSSTSTGVPPRQRVYEVRIEPGGREGTEIDFPQDADAGLPPMTFVVREKKHPYLERGAGDDLTWRCKLTVGQAERGARLKLPLPDGSVLEIESRKGTRSGERTRVSGRGMPSSGGVDRGRRGDVVIEFVVE